VAQRLARTVRDEDLVSRLGGDEFAVIIPGGFDHGTLQAMAARMIAAICSPYSINRLFEPPVFAPVSLRQAQDDSSFVRSIERAADAAAIVHAVVSLGRGLGMKVTAEGVETAEQQLFLRAAGVHSMQGYRFGHPASAAEITRRLAEVQTSGPREGSADLAMAG
jgi:predicted signal transduction protein with EAL and GGDEF domain